MFCVLLDLFFLCHTRWCSRVGSVTFSVRVDTRTNNTLAEYGPLQTEHSKAIIVEGSSLVAALESKLQIIRETGPHVRHL